MNMTDAIQKLAELIDQVAEATYTTDLALANKIKELEERVERLEQTTPQTPASSA